MTLKGNSLRPPHIRHMETARTLAVDTILALGFVYIMAFYYYGARSVVLAVVSVATTTITDMLCGFLRGKRPHTRELSSVVTGLILPLLMPASVSYYILVVAGVFAIAVVKQPFGGAGQNVFNPAAGGFAFAVVCFGSRMFSYTTPLEKLPVFGISEELALAHSPAYTMMLGGKPPADFVEMLLGNFPGPMGATNILVILACLLYLVFRNTVRWTIPISFFLTVSLFAFLFPRIDVPRLHSVALEAMSGMIMFGGVFLLGDPVTTPKRDYSKAVYGVLTAIGVMLFRRYGGFEEAFAFAILLMNAAVWPIDMFSERLSSVIRRKHIEAGSNKKISKAS